MIDCTITEPSETFTEFEALMKMQQQNLFLGQKMLEESRGIRPIACNNKTDGTPRPIVCNNETDDTPRIRH